MKNLVSFLVIAVLSFSVTLFQAERANASQLQMLSLCEKGEKNYDVIYGRALLLKALNLPWMMLYGPPEYEAGIHNSRNFYLDFTTPQRKRSK